MRPFVGTGMEAKAARDSRAVVVSESDGIVAAATAERRRGVQGW